MLNTLFGDGDFDQKLILFRLTDYITMMLAVYSCERLNDWLENLMIEGKHLSLSEIWDIMFLAQIQHARNSRKRLKEHNP